jgi:hypothetical protein
MKGESSSKNPNTAKELEEPDPLRTLEKGNGEP